MGTPEETSLTRRIGAESSKTRAALLDAAQELMREEGYSAVTSRKLAGRAGLKPQLVHYYFRTMDDLFLALFARVAEGLLRKQEALLASDRPVRAICDIGGDPTDTILYVEFMAVGNHRKALRTAIAAFTDTYRKRQSDRLAEMIRQKKLDPDEWKPVALAHILECVSRSLSFEAVLGISEGREETIAAMTGVIEQLEGPPARTMRTHSHKRTVV